MGTVQTEYTDDEGLRIAFRIHKNPFATEPNHGEIVIYNLAKASRDAIFSAQTDLTFVGPKRPIPITLEAGYDGIPGQPGNFGPIFIGHLYSATHTRQGADWVTEIIAADGLLSNEVRSNKAITGPLNLGKLVDLFITEAKTKLGNIDIAKVKERAAKGDLQGVTEQLFRPNGISGKIIPTLDRFLRPKGLELSEQDGEMILLRADETRLDPAIVLGSETGLIGRIDPVKDAKLPGAYVIKGRSLLRHEIRIGSRIELARDVEPHGQFKVRKLEHIGDTHGGSQHWSTHFEAMSIPTLTPTPVPDAVPWGSLA